MGFKQSVIADRVSLTLLLLVTCGAIGGLMAGVALARSVTRSIVELNIPVHAATGALNEVVGPLKFNSNGNLVHNPLTAMRSLVQMARQSGGSFQSAARLTTGLHVPEYSKGVCFYGAFIQLARLMH